jgi:uncharacterized membrane protein YuzA (DUF378 family)
MARLVWNHKAFVVALVLLVVGAVNWGAKGVLGKDLIAYVAGKHAWLVYLLVVLVGVVAFAIATRPLRFERFQADLVVKAPVAQVQAPAKPKSPESFANEVSLQEKNKDTPGPQEFVYVNPASALELVNTATMSTLQHSLMTQKGALVEGPLPAGAPLDAAFAPDQIKVELL